MVRESARARIALIHATPVAMEPIQAAFASGWPEAGLVNILDDSLSTDLAREGSLTPAMFERFDVLSRYARDGGARAILFTCSAFGPAIDRVASRIGIPVLKPNEAMFEAALGRGLDIGMLATFQPAVAPMQEEFVEASAGRHPPPKLRIVNVAAARDALNGGDAETHNRLLAERVSELAGCDAVMLAHFSTSRAARAVQARVGVPVLTAPDAAVAKLRRLVMEMT
jgi:aspartate/glutamate racemase